MEKIVFATNNAHKLSEVRDILKGKYEVLSLEDIGFSGDIPEDSDTLEGNAIQKAEYIRSKTGMDCFADDTGLEVEALGGAPGVHSARYAPGIGHDSAANMALLLKNMEGVENRAARFRTVIALVRNGVTTVFEGIVEGKIATTPSGADGFGYDPVFIPEEAGVTFAQMSSGEKNAISHRGRAVRRLSEYLL